MSSNNRHYWIKEKINGSNVHKAQLLGPDKVPGNKWYAVKVIDCRSLSDIDQRVKNEVTILQALKNFDSIVSLNDVLETEVHYYIVMEYLGGGDVFDRIARKGMYPEEEARVIATNFLSSVDFMHYRRIAHRDLKPQNMLFQDMNNDTDLKIAGFSFAKRVVRPKSLLTRCGTPNYVAPEILLGQPHDEAVDLWSAGVILYIILVGYPPFLDDDQTKQCQRICNADYQFHQEDWGHISLQAKDLIKKLLCVDPDQRLSISTALQHSWITGEMMNHGLQGLPPGF